MKGAGKAIVGWPATIAWAGVIWYFWSTGRVDWDVILGIFR